MAGVPFQFSVQMPSKAHPLDLDGPKLETCREGGIFRMPFKRGQAIPGAGGLLTSCFLQTALNKPVESYRCEACMAAMRGGCNLPLRGHAVAFLRAQRGGEAECSPFPSV